MAQSRIIKRIKLTLITGLVCTLASFLLADQWSRYRYGASLHQMAGRHLPKEIAWQKEQRPSLKPLLVILERLIPSDDRYNFKLIDNAPPPLWSKDWPSDLVGPSPAYSSQRSNYDIKGNPRPVTRESLLQQTFTPAKEIVVNSAQAFRQALKKVTKGDTITFAPGHYFFKGHSIHLSSNGEKTAPIRIRAERLGDVRLQFDLLEGFHVVQPYWIFENLEIEGVCEKISRCEHAFHIVGGGRHATLRNLFIKNFNSPIKVNGSQKGGYPDGGLIEYSLFINDNARPTGNPVSLVDIVAANDWVVRKSVIADFAKAKGDRISYAGFFKGAGHNNLFEQNLVLCEFRHQGGVRVGLSLGGGGTSVSGSRSNDNGTEHFGGALKRNVIANCPLDVGIYLNRSTDTLLAENVLINTTGIHVRFRKSDAIIMANQLDGSIVNRDGGQHEAINNTSTPIKKFLYPESLQEETIMRVLADDAARLSTAKTLPVD